ncbi:HIR complex subunit [Malassezia furfur]|uniref:Protein HIR n=1 Tax=Malassezia furfur TaxID=55194 RepID=A0ABY8EVZ2_MALFU|nr:HIR complex subunit [Malassezia furfur]
MTVQITVPDWVVHRADNQTKRSTIYSLAVHPNGTRLATGGLDTKIRVWATAPILEERAGDDEATPRLLSTLARHTGAVLAVRWSHSGRYLASGSDDTVCFIWDLDVSGVGSGMVFGSSETNLENWRPFKRLSGHESDVTDVAWSESDAYLGTVGLDSLVILWSGTKFERLRTIRAHQGFIKGIAFDPIDQFFATSSDDRTLKVWRTSDGGLEAVVRAPFNSSPSSTFFHRASWSPDGANILASNAMNGPVFVASVVKRLAWSSDISLVGHENAVTVASCSPRLFRGPNGAVATVVALGSLDQSVSVWFTGYPRPLLVARDLFERGVMDLSWSSDGYTLYACSSDGTVAALVFSPDDLGPVLPDDEVTQLRSAFGYVPKTPAPLPASTGLPPARVGAPPARRVAAAPPTAPGERLVQHISRNADGKRRIRPTLLAGDAAPADAFAEPGTKRGADVLASFPASGGRTLGGEKRVAVEGTALDTLAPATSTGSAAAPAPPVRTALRVPFAHGVVDVRNHTDQPSEIALLDAHDEVQWLDFVAKPCVCATGCAEFVAAALGDGTLLWYALRGPRLCTMVLGEPAIHLASANHILAAILRNGQVRCWDVSRASALEGSAQLPPGAEIRHFYVHTNGVPVFVLSNGEALGLDAQKNALRTLASAWLAQHSTAWDAVSGTRDPVRRVEAEAAELIPFTSRHASSHAEFPVAATLRHLEMRMAAAELLDSATEYRQAVHALARQLAEQGIRNQAEELLRALLGPIYYQPGARPAWKPEVCGLSKRELLASVLSVMSMNRTLAELVQHVQSLLDAVNAQ